MFSQELTLQSALDELGENRSYSSFLFTKESALVRLDHQLSIFEKSSLSPEAREKASEPLHLAFNREWQKCDLYLFLRRNLDDSIFGKVEEDVLELLYNAWEHGSLYCETGPVSVEVFLDGAQLCISIEQNGDGFKAAEKIALAECKEDHNGIARGMGLVRIRQSRPEVRFGFEHVVKDHQDKFRSLVVRSLGSIKAP